MTRVLVGSSDGDFEKARRASQSEMSLSHSGLENEPAGVSPRSWRFLLALVVVLIGVVVWDLTARLRAPEPPTRDVQARVAALMLFDAARAIEGHRAASGSLPSDLDLLQLPNADYEYLLPDSGYTVSVRMTDLSATYRSGDDVWRLLDQAGVR